MGNTEKRKTYSAFGSSQCHEGRHVRALFGRPGVSWKCRTGAYFQNLCLMGALRRGAGNVPCCQRRRKRHVARYIAESTWLHHNVLAVRVSGGGGSPHRGRVTSRGRNHVHGGDCSPLRSFKGAKLQGIDVWYAMVRQR